MGVRWDGGTEMRDREGEGRREAEEGAIPLSYKATYFSIERV